MTPDKFPFKLFSHWNSKTISIDSLFQSLANELLASWSKSASSLSHPALFFDLFSKFLREILHIRSRRFPRQKGAVLFFFQQNDTSWKCSIFVKFKNSRPTLFMLQYLHAFFPGCIKFSFHIERYKTKTVE